MIVTINRKRVDVYEAACRTRDCFWLAYDYRHLDARGQPRPVCGRRHQTGCPTNSVCPTCRTVSIEAPGARCPRQSCGGTPTISPEAFAQEAS